jgi:ABC-type sugar transport system permease subunit
MVFVGLGNFSILLKDTRFWQSMQNGVIIFFLSVPIQLITALVLAVILNSKNIKGCRVFRALIFLPFITNKVAAGFVFQSVFATRHGLLNNLIVPLGLEPIAWLDSICGARIALATLIFWGWVGYNMVLMLAGLQTINSEITEAARIDGANSAQVFFYITIPLMRPILVFCTILSIIGSFDLFPELQSLFASTKGAGPLIATLTPNLAIFEQAFANFRFGYASAMSYVFFLFVLILSAIQVRNFNRDLQ